MLRCHLGEGDNQESQAKSEPISMFHLYYNLVIYIYFFLNRPRFRGNDCGNFSAVTVPVPVCEPSQEQAHAGPWRLRYRVRGKL